MLKTSEGLFSTYPKLFQGTAKLASIVTVRLVVFQRVNGNFTKERVGLDSSRSVISSYSYGSILADVVRNIEIEGQEVRRIEKYLPHADSG